MTLDYVEQPKPEGLAQAFVLGADFIGGEPVCLVLGDNIFYGHGLTGLLRQSATRAQGAQIFGYYVRDPQRYGVVEFDDNGVAVTLEEKPSEPRSNYAVPGLYYYGPEVVSMARDLKPSPRGELEITDLNRLFMERGDLHVEMLGRGVAWLDTGTNRSLMEAGQFVQAIEERQSLKISCLEEIAWKQGWITADEVRREAESMGASAYAAYLHQLLGQTK
jgi:glucose-1-phosphate thymidylyltransferase